VLGPDGSCTYCGRSGAIGATGSGPAKGELQVVASPTRRGPEPTCRRCAEIARVDGLCLLCAPREGFYRDVEKRKAALERLTADNRATKARLAPVVDNARRTLAIHFWIQVVLVALTWVLFSHEHSTAGRLFAIGILITGIANLVRGAGLVRQFKRNRKPGS
jgi:hypothetical protein